jgi:hypothetical protein
MNKCSSSLRYVRLEPHPHLNPNLLLDRRLYQNNIGHIITRHHDITTSRLTFMKT